LNSIGKPSILITDSYNSLCNTEFKDVKTKFIESVTSTLRKGGDVIIPTDAASRVFELLLVLETFWRENKSFQVYKIVFLSSMSFRTIEFASHQLEWMSENIVKSFDERRENPFQFKHIQLAHHLNELKKNKHPTVIVSTSESLRTGFSRELFTQKCDNRNNLFLFTQKLSEDSLPHKILSQNKITIKLKKRVPLEGEELDDYEYKRRLLKEAEKKKKRDDEARKKVIEIRDEEESSDEENETRNDPRLFLPENLRYHSQFLMFPCIEKSYSFDEYGQMINVEELESRTTKFIENDEKYEEEIIQDPEEEDFIPPTKCIEETHHCLKNCQVKVLDYEGRPSSKSIKNIISSIKPRKLIIIHGSKAATLDLVEYCQNNRDIEASVIAAPKIFEPVHFTMDTNVIKVKLVEELLNKLNFIKASSCSLAYVEGICQEGTEDKRISLIPCSSKGHQSILIGDLKLTKLRELLIQHHFKTEFKFGCLIVNGTILINKTNNDQFDIQGPACSDYFKIRQLLYSQFQTI
jgi:cleavage and polyadenylation specificity factor subunit 2